MCAEKPRIVVFPPGPRAQAILQQSERCFSNARRRTFPDLVVSRGKDAYVEDVDGNVYLDFAQGITTLGHSNAVIASECHKQIDRFIQTSTGIGLNVPAVLLADTLRKVVPIKNPKVLFCTSGTEACDYAISLSRQCTHRKLVASYHDSYHGLTGSTLAITGDLTVRKRAGSSILENVLLPYPYCYRCPFGLVHPECGLFCLEFAQGTLERAGGADRVASIFIEPIQIHGGLIIAPKDYLAELARFCKRNGIVLVDDEVWTGFGRTGRLFAIEHSGVEPDAICMGKSMGFGFPIAGIVARSSLMDSWELARAGGLGSFGGHAISCTAAKAGLDLILREDLLAHAQKLGRHMSEILYEMYQRFNAIGQVRSIGLLGAAELVKDRRSAVPEENKAEEIVNAAFRKGLLLTRGGMYGNVVRFAPPINVTRQQIDNALSIFDECLKTIIR